MNMVMVMASVVMVRVWYDDGDGYVKMMMATGDGLELMVGDG